MSLSTSNVDFTGHARFGKDVWLDCASNSSQPLCNLLLATVALPTLAMVQALRAAMTQNLSRDNSFSEGDLQNSPSHEARCAADSSLHRPQEVNFAEPKGDAAAGLGTPSGRKTKKPNELPSDNMFFESDAEVCEPKRKSALKRPAASAEVPRADPDVIAADSAGGPALGTSEVQAEGEESEVKRMKRPAAKTAPGSSSKGAKAAPGSSSKGAKAAPGSSSKGGGSADEEPLEKAKQTSTKKSWCPNADYSYKDPSGTWEVGVFEKLGELA